MRGACSESEANGSWEGGGGWGWRPSVSLSRGGGLVLVPLSRAWCETAMMLLLSAQDWRRRWRLEEGGWSCEGEGRQGKGDEIAV